MAPSFVYIRDNLRIAIEMLNITELAMQRAENRNMEAKKAVMAHNYALNIAKDNLSKATAVVKALQEKIAIPENGFNNRIDDATHIADAAYEAACKAREAFTTSVQEAVDADKAYRAACKAYETACKDLEVVAAKAA